MARGPGGMVAAAIGIPVGCASPRAANGPADLGIGDPGSGDDLAGADLAGADLTPPPSWGCSAGAGCASGNPGACAAGHVVCSGGVATCKPDVTTQPCFDGPAN